MWLERQQRLAATSNSSPQVLADNLHAKVAYRANGHYDLGDLWPAVIADVEGPPSGSKEDSASSWGDATANIEAMQADAEKKIAATRSEQWMINKAIHYNEWATLQSQEFAGVAAAYKAFLKSMQCHNAPCSEFL